MLDFPFMFFQVMKFYNLDYEKVMNMPIRFFWVSVRQMERIKAAENLRMARVFSMPQMEEQARKDFAEEQVRIIGFVAESEGEIDREGLEKLKLLAGN